MAELSVSVPYGGGEIRTFNQRNTAEGYGASAYCWLGGGTTDKNLFMQVRLQQDPDLAIIDVFRHNLRDIQSTPSPLIRSQIYALGGDSFSTNVDNYNGLSRRRINLVRLNATTALLKVPYDYDKSSNYVLEVDESTGIVTHYDFDGTGSNGFGGMYDPDSPAYEPHAQYQMFMKNVEDNVVVSVELNGNNGTFLVQKVWDPVAKTLSSVKVASNNGSSCNIQNFSGQHYTTNYGDPATNNGIARNAQQYHYFGNQYQYQSGGYVFAAEGRDGKWYFREARSWSSSHQSISNPQLFAFTYIPTTMGGNLATSGNSTSWGITGGFTTDDLVNGQGRFGSFLPINVKECTTANGAHSSVAYQHSNSVPTFHMESYIELGHSQMLVHMNGASQTKMWYTTNNTSDDSNGRCKWASWLDSNHFAVHSHGNVSSSNYTQSSSNNKIQIIQYVDENYVVHEGDSYFSGYASQTNNGSGQWTKVDDYTVVGNGHNYIMNFWAPE